jgi:hypothetical protein
VLDHGRQVEVGTQDRATERWVYGRVTASGAHLFIDDARGTVMRGSGTLDPRVVRDEFQAAVEAFGRVQAMLTPGSLSSNF